jgi:hypothetical protein
VDELREQFIERFTRAIFQRKGSGFVLKGGGAMRSLFGSQRLTKDVDLDFINAKRTAESLHGTIRRAIDSVVRSLPEAYAIQIAEPGKLELSPRWKINLTDSRGRQHHVEVEVSRDPRRAPPAGVVQQVFIPEAAKGIPRFWVDIYAGPALIATKLAALLGREVPRDVYDLDLLKDAVEPPDAKLLGWAVERAGVEDDPVAVLWARLDALGWERFQAELLDALPETTADRLDEAEWIAMKLRVGEYAENLLAQPR